MDIARECSAVVLLGNQAITNRRWIYNSFTGMARRLKDLSRHTTRGCTRAGPNQALGPDGSHTKDRTVCLTATVHRARSAVSGEHGVIDTAQQGALGEGTGLAVARA